MADQNIALLGAPASGKTTFLAALSIALSRHKSEGQGWNVAGSDAASRLALVSFTMKLANTRAFPAQNLPGAVERYNWLLTGQAMHTVPRRLIGTKRELKNVQIGLQLADASGEMYGADYSNAELTAAASSFSSIPSSKWSAGMLSPISTPYSPNLPND
jgi:hypothetical protein